MSTFQPNEYIFSHLRYVFWWASEQLSGEGEFKCNSHPWPKPTREQIWPCSLRYYSKPTCQSWPSMSQNVRSWPSVSSGLWNRADKEEGSFDCAVHEQRFEADVVDWFDVSRRKHVFTFTLPRMSLLMGGNWWWPNEKTEREWVIRKWGENIPYMYVPESI